MWEGPQCPDSLRFIKEPGPRFSNNICSLGTARFPLLRFLYQPFHNWILFDVVSNKLELPGCFNMRVVVTVLPCRMILFQGYGSLSADVAHQVVYKLRKGPRFDQSKEDMPVVWHDHKCSEIDTLFFHRKLKR